MDSTESTVTKLVNIYNYAPRTALRQVEIRGQYFVVFEHNKAIAGYNSMGMLVFGKDIFAGGDDG